MKPQQSAKVSYSAYEIQTSFYVKTNFKAVLFLLIEEHFKMASFCVELLQSSSSNIRENEVQTIPPEHFSTVEFLLILIGVMIEFFIKYHNSNIKIRSKGKEVPPHQSEIEKKIHTNSFRDAYRSSFKYKKQEFNAWLKTKMKQAVHWSSQGGAAALLVPYYSLVIRFLHLPTLNQGGGLIYKVVNNTNPILPFPLYITITSEWFTKYVYFD